MRLKNYKITLLESLVFKNKYLQIKKKLKKYLFIQLVNRFNHGKKV